MRPLRDRALQIFVYQQERYWLQDARRQLMFNSMSHFILEVFRREHGYNLIGGQVIEKPWYGSLPPITFSQDIPKEWISTRRNALINIRMFEAEHTHIMETSRQRGFDSMSAYLATLLHVRLGYNIDHTGNLIEHDGSMIEIGDINRITAVKFTPWYYMGRTDEDIKS